MLIGEGLTREQGEASVELGQNACQAPHVDCSAIAQAQHDFRRAVEAALDVAVHLLPLKAAAAKVYHLHPRVSHRMKINVVGIFQTTS